MYCVQVGCVFVGGTAVTLSLSGDLNVLSDHTDASPDTRTTVSGHPKPISAIAVEQTGQTYFACSLSALAVSLF
ncbi:hypothetical protein N9M16_03975 [Candidatus Dependentiae bacterium]|nr:hypothetical protein [Candidatus Dependentiae bacterium]